MWGIKTGYRGNLWVTISSRQNIGIDTIGCNWRRSYCMTAALIWGKMLTCCCSGPTGREQHKKIGASDIVSGSGEKGLRHTRRALSSCSLWRAYAFPVFLYSMRQVVNNEEVPGSFFVTVRNRRPHDTRYEFIVSPAKGTSTKQQNNKTHRCTIR